MRPKATSARTPPIASDSSPRSRGDPPEARPRETDPEVHERHADKPRLARGGIHRAERHGARGRHGESVEGEQVRGDRVQALGPDSQIVADGHGHAESTEGHEYRDRLERARPIDGVHDPLRRGHQERREREPVPAQPQQHARRGSQGHEEEHHGAALAGRAGQHRRRESAEDSEGRDAARLPSHGKRRGGGSDPDRQDDGEQLRHQVVDLSRDRHGDEQSRDAGRHARERSVRARLVLVEPDSQDRAARRSPRRPAPSEPLRRSSRSRYRGRTGRRVQEGRQVRRPRRAPVRPPDPRTPSCPPACGGWGCPSRRATRTARGAGRGGGARRGRGDSGRGLHTFGLRPTAPPAALVPAAAAPHAQASPSRRLACPGPRPDAPAARFSARSAP